MFHVEHPHMLALICHANIVHAWRYDLARISSMLTITHAASHDA